MATFTVSIANDLLVYGASDPSFWGTMVWGEDFWGVDADLDFLIGKGLSNTVTSTDTYSKSMIKGDPIANILTSTDAYSKFTTKGDAITNTLTSTDVMTFARLDGVFEFVRPVDKAVDNFGKVADGSASFTTFVSTSTVWTAL